MCVYVYVYMYVYMCVCVCVYASSGWYLNTRQNSHVMYMTSSSTRIEDVRTWFLPKDAVSTNERHVQLALIARRRNEEKMTMKT